MAFWCGDLGTAKDRGSIPRWRGPVSGSGLDSPLERSDSRSWFDSLLENLCFCFLELVLMYDNGVKVVGNVGEITISVPPRCCK